MQVIHLLNNYIHCTLVVYALWPNRRKKNVADTMTNTFEHKQRNNEKNRKKTTTQSKLTV